MNFLFLLASVLCITNISSISSLKQRTIFGSESDSQDSLLHISNFITALVSKTFRKCSLITLTDPLNNNAGHFLNNLNAKIQLGSYRIKLENYTADDNKRNDEPFHEQLANARKYSSRCMLAVIFISHVDSQVVKRIRDKIAPNFLPIIRKDEDHYIFVTPSKFHRSLLLMNELPHRIKFKIAVGVEQGTAAGQLSVSAVDFFGGFNGSPRFIQFRTPDEANNTLDYFPDFVWNLNGALLHVTLPVTKAMVEPDPSISLNNGKRGRWIYLLEEYLMIKFNFTYYSYLSTDINGRPGAGGTGLRLENRTWVGMTGDLLYGRADLGLAIANSAQRIQYIGFSDTHFDFGCLTFVTRQPTKIYSTTAVFWPFHTLTWLCLIGSCVGALFFLALVKVILQDNVFMTFTLSFSSQVRFLLAPFIEQDYTVKPMSTPLRCFIGLWSLVAIVVTNMYRSKLVTLLAFPVLVKLPETFDELAFSDFQIGFMKHGDSALNTFKASTDPVYVTLLKRMGIIEGVGLECLRNVLTHEKYGCVAYDFDVVFLLGRNFTDAESRQIVTATNGRTYNVWLGIATEAHSIYKANFGTVLGSTMAFHLGHIWGKMDLQRSVREEKRKWWRETGQMDKLRSSSQDAAAADDSKDVLSFNHIRGIFYIYLGNVLVSGIVLVYELVHVYIFLKANDVIHRLFHRQKK